VLALAPAPARAQAGGGLQVGHLFAADGWTTFQLGLDHRLLGPAGVQLYGTHLREERALGDRLWGGGLDLTLFRGGTPGVYLVGGVSGGFMARGTQDFWGSWSAGLGYELIPLGFLSLAAEARWRALTPGGRDGVELGIRLGAAVRSRRVPGPAVPAAPGAAAADSAISGGAVIASADGAGTAPSRPAPASASHVGIADSVVMTAAAMMGAGYRLGGTGAGGFDCSGLIQYAFGRHGVALPRTSVEQARQGRPVPRDPAALRPADILTFSNAPGRVTHVGLYVGDGRFIHSAAGGVQLSLLSESDPYGRWWWRRWVGARRIVEGP